MKLVKTDNLREIFYSFIRQLEDDDIISFVCMEDKYKLSMNIGNILSDKTAIDTMIIFTDIRKLVQKGRTVVINLFDSIPVKVYKDKKDGYYVFDNVNIVLNYALYNAFINTMQVNINVLSEKSNENMKFQNTGRLIEKNIFYEKDLESSLENIEAISVRILKMTDDFKASRVTIKNEKSGIELFLLEI